MGVTGLWPILSDLCERKPLTFLSGKKVAVDLSGWAVQSVQTKGLNTSKYPHLRNLFFRVSHLLQLGVFPIFVIDGKPPAVKEAVLKQRHGCDGMSRPMFDKTLKECQELLDCLGVPCIKSSGEAEAFCAFLFLNEIVSGVITEDNDAFLYGADIIYRDFSIKPNDSHVNVYCLKSHKNELDRKKLVALALLLGCDYSKGIPGIGKETALKLLSEMNCSDILQRFKDWKNLTESELFPGLISQPIKKSSHCNRCGHQGSYVKHKKGGCTSCNSEITCYLPDDSNPCRCPWHVWKTELKIYNIAKNCPDFPDLKVIDEYLNFNDTVPSNDVLDWRCPKLHDFQEKAFNFLGWTYENSREKISPLITSWQQYKLKTVDCDKTKFIYEPVEILKQRTKRGDAYFDVKWKLINNECNFPDNLVTSEYGARFSDSYRELVMDFYQQLEEEKEKKRKTTKKCKSLKDCKKIDQFFTKKTSSRNGGASVSKENEESVASNVQDSESDAPSPKKLCV